MLATLWLLRAPKVTPLYISVETRRQGGAFPTPPRSQPHYSPLLFLKRMSSAQDVSFNVLNNTGILYIENGYPVRDLLKKNSAFFCPAGVSTVIPPKCWLIKRDDDSSIRAIAVQLRKEIKRSPDVSSRKVRAFV